MKPLVFLVWVLVSTAIFAQSTERSVQIPSGLMEERLPERSDEDAEEALGLRISSSGVPIKRVLSHPAREAVTDLRKFLDTYHREEAQAWLDLDKRFSNLEQITSGMILRAEADKMTYANSLLRELQSLHDQTQKSKIKEKALQLKTKLENEIIKWTKTKQSEDNYKIEALWKDIQAVKRIEQLDSVIQTWSAPLQTPPNFIPNALSFLASVQDLALKPPSEVYPEESNTLIYQGSNLLNQTQSTRPTRSEWNTKVEALVRMAAAASSKEVPTDEYDAKDFAKQLARAKKVLQWPDLFTTEPYSHMDNLLLDLATFSCRTEDWELLKRTTDYMALEQGTGVFDLNTMASWMIQAQRFEKAGDVEAAAKAYFEVLKLGGKLGEDRVPIDTIRLKFQALEKQDPDAFQRARPKFGRR